MTGNRDDAGADFVRDIGFDPPGSDLAGHGRGNIGRRAAGVRPSKPGGPPNAKPEQ
jgi:hypothetical protein